MGLIEREVVRVPAVSVKPELKQDDEPPFICHIEKPGGDVPVTFCGLTLLSLVVNEGVPGIEPAPLGLRGGAFPFDHWVKGQRTEGSQCWSCHRERCLECQRLARSHLKDIHG